MPQTISDVAKQLGVTKQTVRTHLADLDPDRKMVTKDGNRFLLDDKLVALLAHDIGDRSDQAEAPKPEVTQKAADPSFLKALLDSHERETRAIRETVEAQEKQIADLKDQLRAANERADKLQGELAAANLRLERASALQGFHWPWQRKRIEEHYKGLLPSPDMSRD